MTVVSQMTHDICDTSITNDRADNYDISDPSPTNDTADIYHKHDLYITEMESGGGMLQGT